MWKIQKRGKKNESLTSDLHCFVLRQCFFLCFVAVCCIQSVTFIHTTSNHINKLNFPNNKVSLLFGLAWFSLDTTMGSHLNGHLSFDTFRSMLRKIVQKKNYNRLKNGKLAVPFFIFDNLANSKCKMRNHKTETITSNRMIRCR